jgi:small-conductance mechanosensitive channel
MRTAERTLALMAVILLLIVAAGRSTATQADPARASGARSDPDPAQAHPDTVNFAAASSFETPAPVTIGADTLFFISVRLGPAMPAERAAAIAARLERLIADPLVHGDSVVVVGFADHYELYCRGTPIMAVTDADAQAAGRDRAELAAEYRNVVADVLDREIESMGFVSYLLRILLVAGATLVLILLLWGRKRLLRAVQEKTASWAADQRFTIRIQAAEIISSERFINLVRLGVNAAGVAVLLLLAYVYVAIVFSLFPGTRGWTGTLLGLVTGPVVSMWEGFVEYLPNIFFIAVIVVVTSAILRFLRWIASEIGKGTIVLPGFYKEWSDPTYKLLRFIVLAFSLVVVFPYLPGSGSPAFQGVGVFLGLLLSLGSASAISNLVAGFVLIYMRAFGIGDRVRVADTVGDVVEKSLLVTRIRTIKNVDVTVPNGLVLGSHIVNYSAMARKGGLILHTSVTIGYDAPWKTVHELLVSAALATGKVLREPRPFVFQNALSDFYVEYEINAYTDDANAMQQTYSDLRTNIQDRFNEAGVEIMSPHYTSVRDGNRTAIPDPYLPKPYTPPPFRIFPVGPQAGKGVERAETGTPGGPGSD